MKTAELKIKNDNDDYLKCVFDCDRIQTETYFDRVNIIGWKKNKMVFDIEYNYNYLKEREELKINGRRSNEDGRA